MTSIILIFGVLIILAGVLLIVKPSVVFDLFAKYKDLLGFQIFAVLIRLILGVVLISVASQSKFPGVFVVFGWLTIFAAIVLSVIGRERFKRLINWSMTIPSYYQKMMGLFAVLFGCFLIYAIS